jgi:hypothetical protein
VLFVLISFFHLARLSSLSTIKVSPTIPPSSFARLLLPSFLLRLLPLCNGSISSCLIVSRALSVRGVRFAELCVGWCQGASQQATFKHAAEPTTFGEREVAKSDVSELVCPFTTAHWMSRVSRCKMRSGSLRNVSMLSRTFACRELDFTLGADLGK